MAPAGVSNVVSEVGELRRVLYISYDGLTDPLGQSQILPYLIELQKENYHFTILSFEKPDRLEKEHRIILQQIKNTKISWVPLTFTSRPPVLSKLWDRYKMFRTAKQLHEKNNFDLIHCRSYVAGEVGLKLKNRTGVKFLFDMRGFWADEKVENGQWNLKNPVFKKAYSNYKNKEREMLLGADAVITLTSASQTFLQKHTEYKDQQIDVIPCCADLEHFNYQNVSSDQQNDLRKKLGLNINTKVVTYLGSVGGWYMTKEMFAFFYQLQKSSAENYKLLVLTKDDPQHIRNEAQAAGVNSASLIVTYAERQHLPVFLSLSSVGLFFIRNTFSKIASSPTKHAELMGMGIPVICNDIGDTGSIVEKTKTGLVVKDFSEEGFADAIKNLPALTHIDKSYIRSVAMQIFDLQTGANTYKHIYRRLTDPVQSS